MRLAQNYFPHFLSALLYVIAGVTLVGGQTALLFPPHSSIVGAARRLPSGSTSDPVVGARPDGSLYGTSMSFVDVNGDGRLEIVVGAPSTFTANRTGTVYLLFLSADYDVVESSVELTVTGLDFGDFLGASVSSIGDLDADGRVDILIGAPGDDGVANQFAQSGNVYTVAVNAAGLVVTQGSVVDQLGQNISANTGFGALVLALGDLTGDGFGEFAVGAPNGNSNRTLYIFSHFSQNNVQLLLTIPSPSPSIAFPLSMTYRAETEEMLVMSTDLGLGYPFGPTGGMAVAQGGFGTLWSIDLSVVPTAQPPVSVLVNLSDTFLPTSAGFGHSLFDLGDISNTGTDFVLLVGAPGTSSDRGGVHLVQLRAGVIGATAFVGSQLVTSSNMVFPGSLNAGDRFGTAALAARPAGSDLRIFVASGFDNDSGNTRGAIWSVSVQICGDGVLTQAPSGDILEECDDGNSAADDGCYQCMPERGWTCEVPEDENGQLSVGPSQCSPLCGDTLVVAGEQCDDGNSDSGDGCSSSCQVEDLIGVAVGATLGATCGFYCCCLLLAGAGGLVYLRDHPKGKLDKQSEEFELPKIDQECRPLHAKAPTPPESAATTGAATSTPVSTPRRTEPFPHEAAPQLQLVKGLRFQNQDDVRLLQNIALGPTIGAGHFGQVYQADWKVAVKYVAEDDEENKEEFANEVNILSQLKHQNIVPLLGVFNTKDRTYMVTEYMNRGDYLEILRGEPDLRMGTMASTVVQIAAGMEHIHYHKIVHRDLACRNILASGDNSSLTVKLSDFGLSRITEQGFFVSTDGKIPIRWTSPETLDTLRFDQKSDVWSFGVVLWEIYSRGKNPYGSMGNKEVFNYVTSGKRLHPPPDTPPLFEKLMHLCMSTKPEDRPNFSLLKNLAQGQTVDLSKKPRFEPRESVSSDVLDELHELGTFE